MSQLSPNRQSVKPPPSLPDELWAHIGGFLSESDLARSYSTSPIFFDLWMKTVFTEVKICSMKDQSTLRILGTMTVAAARYVSRLTLCPQFFQHGEAISSFRRIIPQRQAISHSEKLKGILSVGKIPKIIAVQVFLSKITTMTNLKTLVVENLYPDVPNLFGNIGLFLDAVKAHANRLENLEIKVHTQHLEETLKAIPHLATLQSLSLAFQGDASGGATLWKQIAHFINLHSATLRRIVILATRVDYKHIPMFSGLEYLPNLAEVSFSLFADYFTPQHEGNALLEAFLKAHSKQLRRLELYSAGPFIHTESIHPILFHQPLFQVDFPSLTHLEFVLNDRGYYPTQLSMEPPIADLLSRYLGQYRGSLRHLVITTRVLNYSEVQAISSALGEDSSALTTLVVKIESFDANVLTVLARSFPNLDSLSLGHPYLCSTVPMHLNMLPVQCSTFVDSMSNCDPALGRWKLRQLHVLLHEYQCWELVKKVLFSALPNIAAINEDSRQQAMTVNS